MKESTRDKIVKDLNMYRKAKVLFSNRKSELLHIHIAENIFKAKGLTILVTS